VLHYQPIVHTGSHRIVRLEALCRWQHPRRGQLLPKDFIDLTEHDGIGAPFTITVLRQALHDCSRWQHAGHRVGVAVNISPRLLADSSLLATIEGLLRLRVP